MKRRNEAANEETRGWLRNQDKYPASAGGDEPLFFFLHAGYCTWRVLPVISLHTDDADTGPMESSRMTFTCAEQSMMYCKVGRFHDDATQKQILATTSPK
ncbi:hypothetical protein BJ878DRAFT_521902 [Calycina marina]|uniref:Uncharacterized protein n=1 Tax=Calycina marina TaxID=1763456 RepID=A0A9P8CDE3_9HELO|nr:hypothetical protein BJ878DRAFT_521902 [Calycina marina]